MRDPDSILLIEDENLVVETLKGNFQDNGYHIITARNGEEGIRKFQNDNFDLVITDLKLKGMDGLQVSRKIKKINPHTPIILVTGYPKLLSSDEASRFGIHDFVLKPFSWDLIHKKVTDCLETPAHRGTASSTRAADSMIVPRAKVTPRPAPRLERRQPSGRKDPYHNLSQFLFGQTRALEMLIRGEPLKDILNSLTSEMEGCADRIAGSIHLVNAERTQLELMAGPSLPEPLLREIKLVNLAGGVNPWGSAVTQNKPIFVEEIRKSPLWDRCNASAKICGFRGSWSFPLRGCDQQVIGVLTFYSRNSRSPSTTDLKWILAATRMLGTIIEFKNLDHALQQGGSHAENLMEPGPAATVIFNEHGVIDAFNAAAANLFGYAGKTLIGQNIKNLITGQNPLQSPNGNPEASGIKKAAARGLCRDGSRLFLDLSVGELAQQSGRKFIATITDVSKRQYAENICNETRNKLDAFDESGSAFAPFDFLNDLSAKTGIGDSKSLQEQLVQSEKWAATGKLAASLAHEFKNPLFGILNVLERAAREFSLKQGSDDLLELAIRECYRVMDLVKKMQDFQRPSSHSAEPMDLHSAINDMVLLTQPRLHKRNIELELDLDSRLPKIYAIEDQVKQVVLNLLNNAEEALPEDGGKIIIQTEELESSLKIVIRDNGKGIEPNQRQKIFEPFFTTKKDSGGMGLGLPVSYGIIKAHGGRIDIEKGIEGKGASFIITLPKRTSRKGDRRKVDRRSENHLTSTSSWN